MELRHLISFVAVADTGNISNAAKRCSLTQSAVSHHMKALEKEVGAILFERKKKGDIVLTESGKAVVRHARNIIKEDKECLEEVSSINGHICGELIIGVGSFIAPYLRKVAEEFMRKYPDVLLKAEFCDAQTLNSKLKDRKLDLAYTMNTAYHYEGIVSTPCVPFKLSAIMSKKHWLAEKDCVTYEDLMKCGIVMPDCGERVFNTFQKYIDKDLSKLPVRNINTNAGEALNIIEDMNFVTFMPADNVENYKNLVAKPIEGLDMELHSNVHWLKDIPLKESAKKFLEIIKEITDERKGD